MKRNLFILPLLGLLSGGCSPAPSGGLTLRWSVDPADGDHLHTITLVNTGRDTLEAPWSIYFGTIAPAVHAPEGSPLGAEQLCGSHHRFFPTEHFRPLAPGESIEVRMRGPYIDMRSFYPGGAYLVRGGETGAEMPPCDIDLQFVPFHDRAAQADDASYPTAERLYKANARLAGAKPTGPYDILPGFKSVRTTRESCPIGRGFAIRADEGLASEAKLLGELLQTHCGCTPDDAGTVIRLKLEANGGGAEAYRMRFSDEGVTLTASTPRGLFNGAQSLVAVLAGEQLPATLPGAEIEDWPDLPHRGLHFDVARNFTPKENLLRLIDLVSLYKINVLHLHLTDDEGWRLEIPGLEELTEVGSRRGHTLTESDRLCPHYGSGWRADAGAPGSGYYTCEEFTEILRYAAERHIRVIPEIDMPGHSRAAIKSMNARHARYIATDPDRAREYLLADSCDTSVYRSPQDYHDNVMNIGLSSSYAFVAKVLRELRAMYARAGVELTTIHIGGDEVPRGAWEGSPRCREFMARNGLADTHALKDHFVNWMFGELSKAGIQLAGWQEIVMLPDGKRVNRRLPGKSMLCYGWNTTPGEGFDEIPYMLANAGYPVVLCNVTNAYLDLAYNKHWMEPGHRWGGYVDACTTFDLLPYDIYKSVRTHPDGTPADLATASQGKEALRADARRNIVGIQGQLWAETLHDFSQAEYLLFPKLLGLAERAWNAEPAWNTQADLHAEAENIPYEIALRRYYTRIAGVEMPRLTALGVNFRVSPPGLEVRDGLLHANAAEAGATIRYTLDGSDPTEQSPVWTRPVACRSGQVKARAYYCGRESVVAEL